MEKIDYTEGVPTKPSPEFMEWCKGRFKKLKNYIIYRADYMIDPLEGVRKKAVNCRCTACETEFFMPYKKAGEGCRLYSPAKFGFYNSVAEQCVISGDKTTCPYCDEEVEAIHTNQFGKYDSKTVEVIYPVSVGVYNNRLTIIKWRVCREQYKSGVIRNEGQPFEAYIAEDKKIVKLCAYRKTMWGGYSFFAYWEQRNRYDDNLGTIAAEDIFPFNPNMLIGTSAENCKLDVYINQNKNCRPVSYLYLWIKKHNVENIVMSGGAKLLHDIIYTYSAHGNSLARLPLIDNRRAKPHEMLGLTKPDYRYAITHKWNTYMLEMYLTGKIYGMKPEDVKEISDFGGIHYMDDLIKSNTYGADSSMKSFRYLQKQSAKYPKEYNNIRSLLDYERMANQLGYDLSIDDVRYPKNLGLAHDRLSVQIKIKKDELKEAKFAKRANDLEKYRFASKGLEIHPAQSQREMMYEGERLHHCVGSYTERYADGETAIFFIRHTEKPDEPYFTLELNEKNLTVVQNRGLRNCDRTDEVKVFEAEWLEFIKNISKKESKKNGKRVRVKAA